LLVGQSKAPVFAAAKKVDQWPAVYRSTGPDGSLESRRATIDRVVATSTQLVRPLCLDFRQVTCEKSQFSMVIHSVLMGEQWGSA
jgi:hypothetical protein